MTRIREIGRLGATRANTIPAQGQVMETVAELKQRGNLVSPASYIDTANLSEGEMFLTLKAETARIFAEFFPEVPAYKKAFLVAQDVLKNGLHRSNFNSDPIIGAAIAWAKRKTNPASGFTTWEQKQRTPATGIPDPFLPKKEAENILKKHIIGLVPQNNCDIYFPNTWTPPTLQQFIQGLGFGSGKTLDSAGYNAWVTEQRAYRQTQYDKCIQENMWRKLLNDHLKEFAHHPLYEFLGSNNTSQTAITKKVLHQNGISAISTSTKIARQNIRTWQELGIIQRNVEKGAGPQSPAKSIYSLKILGAKGFETNQEVENAGPGGIGDGGLSAAMIAAIVIAILAAVEAALEYATAVKQQDNNGFQTLQNATQGWGTGTWTGQPGDWLGNYLDNNQDGTITNEEKLMGLLPVLMAAGGLGFLLLGNKK